MTAAKPLTIDVVSDVVCPWCFIGKHKMEAALATMPDRVFDVRWHPFQLDPTIPRGGVDRHAYLANKFGEERIAAMHARLEAAGESAGVTFAFDRIKISPNTLDAHRLIRWSRSAGVQNAVKERLMQLYFVEGADIGDAAVLIDVAAAHGMDADTVARLLADGSDTDAVQAEIAQAQRVGVTGVPFFIIAGRYALSGAQEAAVIAEAIANVEPD